MVALIKCIFCDGDDVDNKHECSIKLAGGTRCSLNGHVGTCLQCKGVLVASFERQMKRSLPTPKLHIEEDGA